MFIRLTIPAINNGTQVLDPLPILFNVDQIRSVMPRRVRKPGASPSSVSLQRPPDFYEVEGTYVCTGDGDEGTFAVIEDYAYVARLVKPLTPSDI